MMKRLIFIIYLSIFTITQILAKDIYMYASPSNDLYELLKSEGCNIKLFDTPLKAVKAAKKGSSVLLLADGYPNKDIKMKITDQIWDILIRKKLKTYIEYPSSIPQLNLAKEPLETRLERAVITSNTFGKELPELSLFAIHNAFIIPTTIDNPLIVMAKVVGYDKAEYGLKDTERHPILFDHQGILISTTALSSFKTGRYGPAKSIQSLWENILARINQTGIQFKTWPQDVKPAFTKNERLPIDARKNSIIAGAKWYENGHFFVHESWIDQWLKYQGNGTMPVGPPVPKDALIGDGSLGILEGHTSTINHDGTQEYRYWMRADVQAEAAMALAAAGKFSNNTTYITQSNNLLDYLFSTSNLRADQKNDPKSASYGLIGWAVTHPNSFYADDNARVLLGAIIASGYLETDKWDKKIAEGIMANFRITGKNGFQGEQLEEGYIQENGWKKLNERDITHISPHFESWMWACYLWLYNKTGYKPLLEKTKKAIKITMEAYPHDWLWGSSMQMQRARMILPLAWLVRAEDTDEHREWLRTMVQEVVKFQDESGALREEIGGDKGRRFRALNSNSDYGTDEGSLIFQNGDKATCALYTCNFALFGLNEAAAANNDLLYQHAVTKLSDYLTRIQVQSSVHKDLDGAWLRGFDFGKWDYWASNSDIGWGTWCSLTGWIQSWIVTTQVQMEQNKSAWDLTKSSKISADAKITIQNMMQ